MNIITVNSDAWSQGQIQSKLWLCETLEKIESLPEKPVIWILGGWYGLLAFLLFSRDRIHPALICQFDIDEEANERAKRINNTWIANGIHKFKTFNSDVTKMNYFNNDYGPRPDIIINTACEHFSTQWAELIPKGILVIAQSTNMPHEQHLHGADSLEQFVSQFKKQITITEKTQLDFNYPKLVFSRYMILGSKT
ncbi:MAG: hypothetical protein H7061_13855 [Bdellovibrionaceae bacterium]|nr:hypothetical protein [Bdellovibrio sp.]